MASPSSSINNPQMTKSKHLYPFIIIDPSIQTLTFAPALPSGLPRLPRVLHKCRICISCKCRCPAVSSWVFISLSRTHSTESSSSTASLQHKQRPTIASSRRRPLLSPPRDSFGLSIVTSGMAILGRFSKTGVA